MSEKLVIYILIIKAMQILIEALGWSQSYNPDVIIIKSALFFAICSTPPPHPTPTPYLKSHSLFLPPSFLRSSSSLPCLQDSEDAVARMVL